MINFVLYLHMSTVCSQDAYDAAHETERKRALSALLSQTKQQERKDAEVRNLLIFAVLLFARFCCCVPNYQMLHFQTLAEAKRIMESRAASKVSNHSMLLHVLQHELSNAISF